MGNYCQRKRLHERPQVWGWHAVPTPAARVVPEDRREPLPGSRGQACLYNILCLRRRLSPAGSHLLLVPALPELSTTRSTACDCTGVATTVIPGMGCHWDSAVMASCAALTSRPPPSSPPSPLPAVSSPPSPPQLLIQGHSFHVSSFHASFHVSRLEFHVSRLEFDNNRLKSENLSCVRSCPLF